MSADNTGTNRRLHCLILLRRHAALSGCLTGGLCCCCLWGGFGARHASADTTGRTCRSCQFFLLLPRCNVSRCLMTTCNSLRWVPSKAIMLNHLCLMRYSCLRVILARMTARSPTAGRVAPPGCFAIIPNKHVGTLRACPVYALPAWGLLEKP